MKPIRINANYLQIKEARRKAPSHFTTFCSPDITVSLEDRAFDTTSLLLKKLNYQKFNGIDINTFAANEINRKWFSLINKNLIGNSMTYNWSKILSWLLHLVK